MADAVATGRCTLVTGAMAYKVLVDPSTHRARGVLYIDRETRQPQEIFGRVVALCAQTQESVRILFNSATSQDANGPGQLQRPARQGPDDAFLGRRRDRRAAGVCREAGRSADPSARARRCSCASATCPAVRRRRSSCADTRMATYVGARRQPGAPGVRQGVQARGRRAARVADHDAGLRRVPALRGQLLRRRPRHASTRSASPCRASISRRAPTSVRCWPTWPWRPRRCWKPPARSNVATGPACGARPTSWAPRGWATDPKTSVLNPFLQTHDIKNLFVMDGSSLPVERVAESHADDHGAGRAVHRLLEGTAPAGRAVGARPARSQRR